MVKMVGLQAWHLGWSEWSWSVALLVCHEKSLGGPANDSLRMSALSGWGVVSRFSSQLNN